MRPEYVNDNAPSVETWAEACVISQQWADGARLAAVRRKRIRAVLGTLMVMCFLALMVGFILLVTGVIP
jgi:hypothetical protein